MTHTEPVQVPELVDRYRTAVANGDQDGVSRLWTLAFPHNAMMAALLLETSRMAREAGMMPIDEWAMQTARELAFRRHFVPRPG